jgi:hypothetical protein
MTLLLLLRPVVLEPEPPDPPPVPPIPPPDLDTDLLEAALADHDDAPDAGLIGVGLFAAIVKRLRLLTANSGRARVVETLPASAPLGVLIVRQGDPNVYVGTGSGLRRWPTQAV